VFLNRAKKKWEKPGVVDLRTGRYRWHSRTRGETLHYVFVHEHTKRRGFHSHVLLTLAEAFTLWSRKILTELTHHPGDQTSVKIVAPTSGDRVKRAWLWMRYCMKGLSPRRGLGHAFEPLRSYRKVLRVWPYQQSLPMTCHRLTGANAWKIGARK
jgi:hypothetical protein